MSEKSAHEQPEVLFDAETIATRVRALGAAITEHYQGGELVLVVVLKGSFVFAADLARSIDLPLTVDFLGVRSYGDATRSSGVVQITSDLSHPLAGKDVLVVEDIVDTGLTLRFMLDNLKARAPRSVKLAALLHKPSRTRTELTIDYLGFQVDDVFVVGYGLDHAERYRNLSYVGILPKQTETPQMNPRNRLQTLERLIEKGSRDPFVRYARALELRGMGEVQHALHALHEVRRQHPEYVPTFLMAGQMAAELDQLEEAREWFTQGMRVASAARDEHARSELEAALQTLPA